MASTLVFLPGEFCGRRSLAGPWGCKVSNLTEWLHFHFSFFFPINMTTVLCLVTQTCPMLCSPLDCSPPGSSVHGIFSGKNPGVVAISFSRGPFWPRDQTHVCFVSCIAGRVSTYWATGKAPVLLHYYSPAQSLVGCIQGCGRVDSEGLL